MSVDANAPGAAPAPSITSRAGPNSGPTGDAVEQRLAGCDGREYEQHARGQRRFDMLDRAQPFDFSPSGAWTATSWASGTIRDTRIVIACEALPPEYMMAARALARIMSSHRGGTGMSAMRLDMVRPYRRWRERPLSGPHESPGAGQARTPEAAPRGLAVPHAGGLAPAGRGRNCRYRDRNSGSFELIVGAGPG